MGENPLLEASGTASAVAAGLECKVKYKLALPPREIHTKTIPYDYVTKLQNLPGYVAVQLRTGSNVFLYPQKRDRIRFVSALLTLCPNVKM